MSTIDVRPADERDVQKIAAIYVNASRTGWAHIFDEPSLATLRPPVDRMRAELASADGRHHVLVAEREGQVIAFAVVRPSEDDDADSGVVGELDQFFSDPSVWGQGVGRRLLAVATETLREGGFAEATLWTAKENRRPRRIYEVAGWRLDGATRDKTWRGASFQDVRYRIEL